ncbi:MAG TPA: 3-phosphoglycerate dehydrogenase family protein [Bryobacteraceae bacterium]|nr:3-phosphoglycerate dehydrogenase family protein [Bryobacteraceae bacterium]
MRVLIADKFEQSGVDGLTSAGCEVSYQPGLKDDALAAAVEAFRPDALVVRSTAVNEAILSAGALKLVVRAGAGYNTIDVAAASRRGIYVSNCPGKNSVAVAELAFGLMLSLDRKIPDNVIALRQGQWRKGEFSKARGLFGRTLGLVGVGQIGREMIPRARGFGMRVAAWSRSLTAESAAELGVERKNSAEEVAAVSDAVSIHVALNSQTRGLLGARFFEAMRPGALFVNTARAELVDPEEMSRAIREKGIRVGLDVYAKEPSASTGDFADPIAQQVYGTHHIGASTEQAQDAIAAETVRIVQTFQETGKVPNVVNLARTTPATCALIVRHLDRPGVLASVLDAISGARINVQEMENVVFEGAEAAVARIHLETEPAESLLEQVRSSNANILELSVIRQNRP